MKTLAGLEWVDDRALCAQTDPERWFPDKGDNAGPAVAICSHCPLLEPCLSYALDDPATVGVWGGTTQIQRRRLRRRSAA